MYLKRIELQGFKSFAGKTVLEFHKGITSVVGPNGSGKSNLADAVRWVLGEQSAKELRGSKMMDVIFSGTEFRRAVGYAEVSLVIDNENRGIPIEYTEVIVTRRLFRSGESEYSINGSQCRLKDIYDLFLDTGVGREGYSIIGQGKIHEILSVKSEDRRAIFEEASGIMKYKVKKMEAQRKLAKTEENLVRVADIIHEIERQLEPLRLQAEKAKEYLVLRDRLKILEVGLYLNNLNIYEKRITRHAEEIEAYNGHIDNLNVMLSEIHADIQANKEKLRETELSEEKARGDLNDFIMRIETAQHEISIIHEKINAVVSDIRRMDTEIQEIDLKKKILEADYLKREERIAYLNKEQRDFSGRLEEAQAEMARLMESMNQKEKEIQGLKNEVMESMDDLSELKLAMRTLQNENASIDESLIQTEKRLAHLRLEKDSVLLKRQDEQAKVLKIKKESRELEGNINLGSQERKALEDKLGMLRQENNEYGNKLGIINSNHEILSEMDKRLEGYADSVKWILEKNSEEDSGLTGIVNVLGRLIDTDEAYEQALEGILGPNLQAVVTKDEGAARRGMAHLQENNHGRVVFIPLDMKGKEKTTDGVPWNKEEGCLGNAVEFVKCEKRYGKMIERLLSDVLIADQYENALRIWEKAGGTAMVATLAGEVISKEGTITGGKTENTVGILGRQRKIENLRHEKRSLQEKIEGVEAAILQTGAMLTETKSKLERMEVRLQEQKALEIQSEGSMGALDREQHRISEELETQKRHKEGLEHKKSNNAGSISSLLEEITLAETGINKKKISIAEYEMSCENEKIQRNRLAEIISDMRVSLNSVVESLKSTSEAMERLSNEKSELEQKDEYKVIELQEMRDNEIFLRKTADEKKLLMKNPEETKAMLKKEVEKFTRIRKCTEEESDAHVDRISEINREIILVQNKMGKVEVNQAKVVSEMDLMKARMWDEYNLTHNEAMQRHSEIDNIERAKKEIRDCRSGIGELGNVNINAIDDYTQTNERYQFLTSQRDDLHESKENLYKVIREMNLIMEKIFAEKFEVINGQFNEIFQRLFEGGKARIELCDEANILESGIDIIVQPPGKKLQNMMLLSGGEKAFTAIALLFSILLVNPAPFCIFDEIEAALDDANVIKFAEYLSEYKKNTQFIMITHRKGTMEYSDSIYGVTMQEHGISKVVSMKMNQQEA
ncbi:MAG: chromosome segregation protein SMC [Clostridia bacterium]